MITLQLRSSLRFRFLKLSGLCVVRRVGRQTAVDILEIALGVSRRRVVVALELDRANRDYAIPFFFIFKNYINQKIFLLDLIFERFSIFGNF